MKEIFRGTHFGPCCSQCTIFDAGISHGDSHQLHVTLMHNSNTIFIYFIVQVVLEVQKENKTIIQK